MMQADLLFKNAEIFDPDTLEIKRGELAVTGTVISGKGEKLDCQAKKEIDLKGNIFKGPFHLPRCLMENVLQIKEILKNGNK